MDPQVPSVSRRDAARVEGPARLPKMPAETAEAEGWGKRWEGF